MLNHSLIIHGHFYQPPREDPFSGQIPSETGAEPFPNWNERIYTECYAPNASRGNFEKISFNFGPTLFEWLEASHRSTSESIVRQDQANLRHFGVGNALAQPYHHTILPLASRRDKFTQVHWGIVEFTKRFNRLPEGMWLPETAVDQETLEILAEQGIQFTILAPWQAAKEDLDSTEPYIVSLENGRQITVFFYQQDLSSGISFAPALTSNADHFLDEYILPKYNPKKNLRAEPQMLLLASDGELYGHHQQFRDQFLARLVNGASRQRGISPTYPALWLREHPPRQTIDIRDQTSWSCQHGVQRWRGDCGCIQVDGSWKMHLRAACDLLAEALDGLYSQAARNAQIDPWQLRNRYIHVVLGEMSADQLVNDTSSAVLPAQIKTPVLQLLEAQHLCQKMYTSCAWFFDDFNRIEPKNCLANAAQAVHLIRQSTGVDLSDDIRQPLARVTSKTSDIRGDSVFNRYLSQAENN